MTVQCSIDGCTRSTNREGTTNWICSVHWRRYCPPRSLRRRTYHRFFRDAKRHGWDYTGRNRRGLPLNEEFWLFWDLLVRLANAAEKRDAFDTTEINKLFGWTDD